MMGHVIFIIVTAAVEANQLFTLTKHSKCTFVTLLKRGLPQNCIDDFFASSYCVSVRRLFCYNKSTISNELQSATKYLRLTLVFM